jgi:hypothetical protein
MFDQISLDGAWEFMYVADDRQVEPIQVRSIQVPGPWQAQFHDLRMRAGIGVYRREVDVPEGWKAGRTLLRFGAVFHHTRVWVNGMPAGQHEGGFLPFVFDVSEWLVEGRNEIKLRVESPTDNPLAYPDAPFAEIPFGKQSWYGPLSGVWQPVVLERRAKDLVERLKIGSELGTGRVTVTVHFFAPIVDAGQIRLEVRGPDGRVVAQATDNVVPGDDEASFALVVEDPQAWSPEKPSLYTVAATMERDGAAMDTREDHFGFRTIETRNGRLYLNGAPIYLRAALDQDYYPETICTVPSLEFLEDQARKAKELGLNCLRCHIKAADPRYYDVADRYGLLVWTELPNGGLSTERSRARKQRLLKGIVDRDGNHPSIVIWTIINENWGVDLVHDAGHRAWLKQTYHWLKGYDPTRLVVDNSPLSPSFHVETDIADYHYYAAFPDNRRAWDAFVDELGSRASWLFSPEGDAVIKGDEPVMCSEFGNWGLPNPRDLAGPDGKEPWWFETGHDWGEGVMYAHGVENRFVDWSLDRVFGSLDRFVAQAQWQQYRALKYEIETMRRRPNLAGYVITEFTDVHWEANGLLDMKRNPRVFHSVFHKVNADIVIVPRWERLSYWSGEAMKLDLSVAHGAGADIASGRVETRIDGAVVATHAVGALESGGIADLGVVDIPLPEIAEPKLAHVEFAFKDAEGVLLASNHLDVAIHSPPVDGERPTARLYVPDPAIREHMAALGYPIVQALHEADTVVAESVDKAIVNFVREGGSLVYLPSAKVALYPFFPHWQAVEVVPRAGTLWAGDWASTFAWLVRCGPFARFPGGPLIDETFDRVIPTHVIRGSNLLDFQGRVHAGIVIGWIHKPAAYLVERAYGEGRFVASTFRLFRDPPGADPTATMLIHELVRMVRAGKAAVGQTMDGAQAAE